MKPLMDLIMLLKTISKYGVKSSSSFLAAHHG